jgi:hypothetical protein
MNAPIPAALAAHLNTVGVVTLTPPKPADPRIAAAILHGVSMGWKPTPGDTEPPF